MSRKDKQRRIEHWQIIAAMLAVYDAVAVNLAYFLALWFRFDCMYSEIPSQYLIPFLKFALRYSFSCLLSDKVTFMVTSSPAFKTTLPFVALPFTL